MQIDPTLVQAFFTIIIAVATIIYVIKTNDIAMATRQQVLINERLNELSSKQMLNIDRPILSLSFEGGTLSEEGATISFALHNIGTGPALDVKVFYGISKKGDTYYYDPRTLEITRKSPQEFLPLARDSVLQVADSVDESFSRGMLELSHEAEGSDVGVHLYIYCFYENIFRARYKSVYPLSVNIGNNAYGMSRITMDHYLKPLIRPVNRYEAELEEMEKRYQKDI